MNRKEGKKIAVMAAIIVGFMVFAFMPLASATVTSFTVEPGTGLAGAVDSYNVLVTTDGVTKINISIPAGFIAVVPMSGGVEIARVDFWNSSTKAHYGHATITANNADPTTKVDIHCDFGGLTASTTQTVNYDPGAINTFESGFGGDTSSAITKLPTEDDNGSIEITINCTAFYLDDVMIAIKQFVRNPTTAGDYVFTTDDGKTATVSITAPSGGRCTVFRNGHWYVDTNGDSRADRVFYYGQANDIPLVGDIDQNGGTDIAVVRGRLWYVDTNCDHAPDQWFYYGQAGDTFIVADINQDGLDDIAAVRGRLWYVDTNCDQVPDQWFYYGQAGDTFIVADINRDGYDDIAAVRGRLWYVDTNCDQVPDQWFYYGQAGDKFVVSDINGDGHNDIAAVRNQLWYVDTTLDRAVNLWFYYGLAGDTPLTGDI
jgi:hypothetical protein